MKHETIITLTDIFEAHAQETEGGIEYWLARDLQYLLGYSKWDNFLNILSKAKTACEVSGHEVLDHFADVGKMVDLGSGNQREIADIMLTGTPATRPLADFAPTIILKAKDFATEITIHNAREHHFNTEQAISTEPVSNNRAVRNTLLQRGIRPEQLPPAEDLKKVERRLVSEEKKSLKNPDPLGEGGGSD